MRIEGKLRDLAKLNDGTKKRMQPVSGLHPVLVIVIMRFEGLMGRCMYRPAHRAYGDRLALQIAYQAGQGIIQYGWQGISDVG